MVRLVSDTTSSMFHKSHRTSVHTYRRELAMEFINEQSAKLRSRLCLSFTSVHRVGIIWLVARPRACSMRPATGKGRLTTSMMAVRDRGWIFEI